MKKAKVDYDSPWKESVEQLFEDCIKFFFQDIHALIDWPRGYTFMDKEFQKITRDAKTGKRYVDKLAKAFTLTGEDAWILLHLEVQGTPENEFEERTFVYHYRIFDYYRRPVVSLVILTDERPDWYPSHFGYQLGRCRLSFDFPVAKLLDYRGREEELANNPNPFAIVVLAHLQSLAAKREPTDLYDVKFTLIKQCYKHGFTEHQVHHLLRFIDWVLILPPQLEQQLWTDVEQFEKEITMPYVTSFERIATQKGRLEGKLEGRLEGKLEGRLEGKLEGRLEGRLEGKLEGRLEGVVEQTRKLVLETLLLRFNYVPDTIQHPLNTIQEVAPLQQLFRSAVTAESFAVFQQQLTNLTTTEST